MSAAGLFAVQVVSGLEIAHGGPSYSVPRLHDALRQAGIGDRIFADLIPGEAANDAGDGIVTLDRQFGTWPLLRKLHISSDMSRRLHDTAEGIDLIHSHGLWRMPNIYAARAARRRGVPHVISPRGMLSPVAMRFSRASKWLFSQAGQRTAIEQAACIHATSEAEHDEIRARSIRVPIAVIPNGVDLPALPPDLPGTDRRETSSPKTLLYIGRIHPKKGLDALIAAWVQVAPQFPDWHVRIVGPGEEAHIHDINQLVIAAGAERLSIEPPVYGDAKWHLYRSADLFVMPSYNENFGLTVAESLACRRPVIATKGMPWSGLEANRCGWWIDTGEVALAATLRTALGMPAEVLDTMGRRGEAWVAQAFSWDAIGREMAGVYQWTTGRGPKPQCVHLA